VATVASDNVFFSANLDDGDWPVYLTCLGVHLSWRVQQVGRKGENRLRLSVSQSVSQSGWQAASVYCGERVGSAGLLRAGYRRLA
jgi:hypothetical protein